MACFRLTRSQCHGRSRCRYPIAIKPRRSKIRRVTKNGAKEATCPRSSSVLLYVRRDRREYYGVRHGEPRTSTSTFTQLLSSDTLENCFILHTSACVPVPVPSNPQRYPSPPPPTPQPPPQTKGEGGGLGGWGWRERFGSVSASLIHECKPTR